MARRTKEEAQATREAILEAAAKVFVDKGVAKATLDAIAKEAGVTRGAIYWHFKNKLEVFAALHDQLYTSTIEIISNELNNQHPDPLLQLQQLCLKLFDELQHNTQKRRILTIFFLRCDYSGDMAPFLEMQRKQKQKSFYNFAHFFQRAIDQGQLSGEISPMDLTRMLTFYLTGIATEYLRYPDLFEHAGHSEACLIKAFIEGLKAS